MNTSSTRAFRLRVFTQAILSALAALGISSCNTTNKPDGGYTEYSGRQPNYPVDGHYNPYKPGEAKPAASTTQYQEYSQGGGKPSGYEKQPTKKASTTKNTASSTVKKKTATDSDDIASAKPSSTKKKATKTTSTDSGKTVTAKPGDTFYGLAKKYHTTVDAMKKANNRTSDIVRDGEKLKIP